MNKLYITIFFFLLTSIIKADYMAKIPLEQNQGGSLPNNSINIKNIEANNSIVCRFEWPLNYDAPVYGWLEWEDNLIETFYNQYMIEDLENVQGPTRGDKAFERIDPYMIAYQICTPANFEYPINN